MVRVTVLLIWGTLLLADRFSLAAGVNTRPTLDTLDRIDLVRLFLVSVDGGSRALLFAKPTSDTLLFIDPEGQQGGAGFGRTSLLKDVSLIFMPEVAQG
jgi:hypothetical protein